MFAMQYTHRLPAEHDMGRIRARAAALGPQWDATEGLAFKAFVARERGRDGAPGNAYASVYLWLATEAATRFLAGERFRNVTDSFGRPRVETWLGLDARTGPAAGARTLYREDVGIDDTTDLRRLHDEEAERARALAARGDTLAVATALDPGAWRLLRLTLSAEAPDPARAGTPYEVLYLARPGLAALGRAD